MRVLAVTLLALVVATPAQASNWVLLSRGNDGTALLVDRDSIRATSTGYKVWSKFDYRAVKAEKAREMREQSAVNCEAETITVLSAIVYAPDGRVMRTYDPRYPDPQPVAPDTLGHAIMRYVCGN